MDNLLITTSCKSLLHRNNGTQTEIILTSAEINTVTVNIFNIPLGIYNEKITETLATAYNFPIYSDIYAIKMEVQTPFHLDYI